MVIKTERKYKKIFVDEILYCKADGAYAELFLSDNKSFVASKLLKDIEALLKDYNFFRINKSYLVNLDHCIEIQTGDKPKVLLSSEEVLPVSPPRMKLLKEKFCVYS
ncbi:MAG: LytTR family transcriptional regulator [Bacteroidales bacterium]|nr:LytTR family transcriptional regulator [Bacteroidales bacterium]